MFHVQPPRYEYLWRSKTCQLLDSVALQSIYIALIGVLGFCFSTADVLTLLKCEILPPFMKCARLKGIVATPREERDLKIIVATFTSFFYILLSLGILYDHCVFIYPYLIMQSLMISGEILIFFVRLNNNCQYCITKRDLLCALFTLINWKVVFNYLQRKSSEPCCYCT